MTAVGRKRTSSGFTHLAAAFTLSKALIQCRESLRRANIFPNAFVKTAIQLPAIGGSA